jgi:HD superfamily phosphohydrolase YqeK
MYIYIYIADAAAYARDYIGIPQYLRTAITALDQAVQVYHEKKSHHGTTDKGFKAGQAAVMSWLKRSYRLTEDSMSFDHQKVMLGPICCCVRTLLGCET